MRSTAASYPTVRHDDDIEALINAFKTPSGSISSRQCNINHITVTGAVDIFLFEHCIRVTACNLDPRAPILENCIQVFTINNRLLAWSLSAESDDFPEKDPLKSHIHAIASQRTVMGKTFLTQVHLTLYYSTKKKECYFGQPDCKESSANIQHEDYHDKHNLKMIDEAESQDDGKLLSSQSMITEPITTCVRQSMANHNASSIKRTLSSLPGKLEIVTSSDRTKLHPAREKHSLDGKKGFSSITITARRYITSLCHAPKEITSDLASSLCRSNDLLMKAPVSSVEHNQQCRFLDNGADCSQLFQPSGFIHSQEFPPRPIGVSNTQEADQQYIKNPDRTTFTSVVHIKTGQTCPSTVYYRPRLFSVSLAQCHGANQRTYKSEMSFRIKPPLESRHNHTFNNKSVEPPRHVIRNQLQGEHKKRSLVDFERPNRKPMKAHHRNQEQQVDGYHHDPCQDVSNYLNIEAFDFPHIQKKDPVPASEIYAEKSSPLHPGAERSSITTFSFIFGKQISNQGRSKQSLQKENVPLKGYKWGKSCGNIGRNDKENMPLPEVTENKPGRKPLPEKMSLQEALEHHRPDFIYKSQERLHKLELMARQRKIQNQDPNLCLQKDPQKFINQKRKLFTVPHPLSDNLFKPKERTIPEKEMLQRSKRIYNSLPEVKRKKEEEEKRLITQSNRVRAQLFKKKILDQILQRSSD
ncbi:(E2-independent) E3 ubiquitin-conjugating enzyme FATS [Dendropsophus ebraccatus]|uniref:(E2-independent) E3 ubiquitin-conjugating enzyme FATS n=1 Tax=Dendropsophus ebraccatus TaxID=150705 RepID=UPI0038310C4A